MRRDGVAEIRLDLISPSTVKRDRHAINRTDPHRIRRACHAAAKHMTEHAHRDHAFSRTHPVPWNGVTALGSPDVRIFGDVGAADLLTVKISSLMLVAGAEMQLERTTLPLPRNFHFAAEPESTVELVPSLLPVAGQVHHGPIRAVGPRQCEEFSKLGNLSDILAIQTGDECRELIFKLRFDRFGEFFDTCCGECLVAHPLLDAGSSHCGNDKPDGHRRIRIQEPFGKVISHATDPAHALLSVTAPLRAI